MDQNFFLSRTLLVRKIDFTVAINKVENFELAPVNGASSAVVAVDDILQSFSPLINSIYYQAEKVIFIETSTAI